MDEIGWVSLGGRINFILHKISVFMRQSRHDKRRNGKEPSLNNHILNKGLKMLSQKISFLVFQWPKHCNWCTGVLARSWLKSQTWIGIGRGGDGLESARLDKQN